MSLIDILFCIALAISTIAGGFVDQSIARPAVEEFSSRSSKIRHHGIKSNSIPLPNPCLLTCALEDVESLGAIGDPHFPAFHTSQLGLNFNRLITRGIVGQDRHSRQSLIVLVAPKQSPPNRNEPSKRTCG